MANNPAAIALNLALQVLFGIANGTNRNILSYSEPTTSTAQQGATTSVKIANAGANVAINLATLFPGITTGYVITIKDVSGVPAQVSVSTANTGTKFVLAAGGALVIRTNTVLPTLFFDNASGNDAYLEIGAIGI